MAKAKTKDELIQEAQNKGLEFDGGMTVEELQAIIDRAKTYDPNTPEADSVPTPVTVPVLNKERCWNCYAQDRRTRNTLDKSGVCSVCGFDKKLVYNGNLEADKAAQKVELARAAERN